MDPMTAGQLLRLYRNQSNLNQQAVADALGVTRTSVSNWENDKTPPFLGRLDALFDLLDLTDAQRKALVHAWRNDG